MFSLFAKQSHRHGVSLVEMLISLAIFSVIVFPLVVIPAKAIDQSEQSKNQSLLRFELDKFFDKFGREVNSAYRFYPLALVTDGSPTPVFDPTKQLFVAYWDDIQQREVRVGYALREITGSSPKRWQLYRAEIPEGANLQDYTYSALWGPVTYWRQVGRVIHGQDFYLASQTGDIGFVYCRGTTCNNSITPKAADGVRIQAIGSDPTFDMIYKNSAIAFQPLYFQLASLQAKSNRHLAETQILPFATAVGAWSSDTNWLVERKKDYAIGTVAGSVMVPVADTSEFWGASCSSIATSSGFGRCLNYTDMHYNYRTGELLLATSSADHANPLGTDSAVYLFKFKPGFPDYRPFSLNLSSPNTSYLEPFPKAIHRNEAGWPGNWSSPRYFSVTQDLEDYIYVLVQNGTSSDYAIQRFSPQGEFVSEFMLGPGVAASAPTPIPPGAVSKAIGITFNPAAPDEIIVLLQKPRGDGTGEFVLRSYPKKQHIPLNQSLSGAAAVGGVISAESRRLDDAAVTPDADFATRYFGSMLSLYMKAQGIEYDPIHNRYFILFSYGQQTSVLSLDSDLSGTPVDRARVVSTLWQPPVAGALSPTGSPTSKVVNATGLAFDPFNNYLYVGLGDVSPMSPMATYQRVVPNTRLAVVRK